MPSADSVTLRENSVTESVSSAVLNLFGRAKQILLSEDRSGSLSFEERSFTRRLEAVCAVRFSRGLKKAKENTGVGEQYPKKDMKVKRPILLSEYNKKLHSVASAELKRESSSSSLPSVSRVGTNHERKEKGHKIAIERKRIFRQSRLQSKQNLLKLFEFDESMSDMLAEIVRTSVTDRINNGERATDIYLSLKDSLLAFNRRRTWSESAEEDTIEFLKDALLQSSSDLIRECQQQNCEHDVKLELFKLQTLLNLYCLKEPNEGVAELDEDYVEPVVALLEMINISGSRSHMQNFLNEDMLDCFIGSRDKVLVLVFEGLGQPLPLELEECAGSRHVADTSFESSYIDVPTPTPSECGDLLSQRSTPDIDSSMSSSADPLKRNSLKRTSSSIALLCVKPKQISLSPRVKPARIERRSSNTSSTSTSQTRSLRSSVSGPTPKTPGKTRRANGQLAPITPKLKQKRLKTKSVAETPFHKQMARSEYLKRKYSRDPSSKIIEESPAKATRSFERGRKGSLASILSASSTATISSEMGSSSGSGETSRSQKLETKATAAFSPLKRCNSGLFFKDLADSPSFTNDAHSLLMTAPIVLESIGNVPETDGSSVLRSGTRRRSCAEQPPRKTPQRRVETSSRVSTSSSTVENAKQRVTPGRTPARRGGALRSTDKTLTRNASRNLESRFAKLPCYSSSKQVVAPRSPPVTRTSHTPKPDVNLDSENSESDDASIPIAPIDPALTKFPTMAGKEPDEDSDVVEVFDCGAKNKWRTKYTVVSPPRADGQEARVSPLRINLRSLSERGNAPPMRRTAKRRLISSPDSAPVKVKVGDDSSTIPYVEDSTNGIAGTFESARANQIPLHHLSFATLEDNVVHAYSVQDPLRISVSSLDSLSQSQQAHSTQAQFSQLSVDTLLSSPCRVDMSKQNVLSPNSSNANSLGINPKAVTPPVYSNGSFQIPFALVSPAYRQSPRRKPSKPDATAIDIKPAILPDYYPPTSPANVFRCASALPLAVSSPKYSPRRQRAVCSGLFTPKREHPYQFRNRNPIIDISIGDSDDDVAVG